MPDGQQSFYLSFYLKIQHNMGLGQNFSLAIQLSGTGKWNTICALNLGPVLLIMEFCFIYQITWTILQAIASSKKWLNKERKWEDDLGFQNVAFKIGSLILVTLLSATSSPVWSTPKELLSRCMSLNSRLNVTSWSEVHHGVKGLGKRGFSFI